MATLEELRDERANAILSYYSNLEEYNAQTDADGTDSDTDKPQRKFRDFNNLIDRHHDELKTVVGYASSGTAYLPSAEGAIDTTQWWYNANNTNLRASMFFQDAAYLQSRNSFFMANGQSEPNQRHPYAFWNQYHSQFGTYNNFGWKNASSKPGSPNTYNPFATGANYRCWEPLEWYGSSNNLLWGRIVHNGRWAYRSAYIGNSSFTTISDAGLNNYTSTGKPINNLLSTQTVSNVWPSPYEVMRYTYWGNGSNSPSNSRTISAHTGTITGSFQVTAASQFTPNTWYIFYSGSTSNGWILRVGTETDLNPGFGPYQWTYTNAYWPTPSSGAFNGTRTCVENPTIPSTQKIGPTDGRANVWKAIYDQYYTGTGTVGRSSSYTFKAGVDNISTQVSSWSSNLNTIISFNYTVINQEAGSDIGKSEATTVKTNVDNWLTAWKTLINDTGSGATYIQNDSRWSDANLSALFTNGSGGLNLMISFAGSVYTGTQSGYIASRRTQIYNDLFGDYTLGGDEEWNPALEDFPENNTGNLASAKLYYWRHVFIDQRLNRENGTLSGARNAYYTYLNKLQEISDLEAEMGPLTSNNKYDITPIDNIVTLDQEESINVDWEDVKASASYYIQRKEGLSGGWVNLATQYGYVDPGTPPDFSSTPPSSYDDPAETKGYQEFGLTLSSVDDATGLTEDFTIYDFYINVDGAGATQVELRGLDCKSFEALRVSIQKELDELELEATVEFITDDIRITSDKRGAGSSIAITAGTINDLLVALATTPNAASPGGTTLHQGRVYYYRMRVNNGYNDTLGGGAEVDKDWDSQSEWQTDEYLNDQATHGDPGIIVWEPPGNLQVGGVDPGVTPSDVHCRLEWEASPNADSYKVYRATLLDGGYAYIGSTSNLYYEDTTGIAGYVYYYKVKAVASTDHQLFDDSGNLSGPIESLLTDEGIRGKKLWQTITLDATRLDPDKVTLTWNSLSGATDYLVYTSPVENGTYSYLSEDDATELLISGSPYDDARPARQFFEPEYSSTSDGILAVDYTASRRYYFIAVCTDDDGSFTQTIRQYYITSPASGTWTCQDIADAIQAAFTNGLDNLVCELVAMENPEPHYKIRITTKAGGSDAAVSIAGGTFGNSLLTILPVISYEPGDGAYLAIEKYYKVQAVEVVSGEIARYSEFSNIAVGLRPIPI